MPVPDPASRADPPPVPPGDRVGGARRPGPAFAASVDAGPLGSSHVLDLQLASRPAVVAPTTHPVRTEVFARPAVRQGTVKPLRMDLQVPRGTGPAPTVLFLPGGGFMHVDRTGLADQREQLVVRGFAVAAMEYRLIPDGADHHDGLADVRSAVRYLREHADELGLDADHLALWGESAGGYLAALAALAPDALAPEPSPGPVGIAVGAVVDWYGVSDLSDVGADFDEATRAVLRSPGGFPARYLHGPGHTAAADDDPGAASRADPAIYARAGSPPFLLFHGDEDRVVSPRQTRRLHEALRTAGGRSTRYVIPGAGHGDIVPEGKETTASAWRSTAVMDLVADFLDEHLRGPGVSRARG